MSVIPIVIIIEDDAHNKNKSFFSWSFITEGSRIPILINMDPTPCDVNVTNIHNISFEVIDAGHGLDGDSIVMGISNKKQEDLFILPIIHRFSR